MTADPDLTTLVLPATMIGIIEQKHNMGLWTSKECHKQLLCLVEQNLSSCGLLPDEARRTRKRYDPNVRNEVNETLLHACVRYRSALDDHVSFILFVSSIFVSFLFSQVHLCTIASLK